MAPCLRYARRALTPSTPFPAPSALPASGRCNPYSTTQPRQTRHRYPDSSFTTPAGADATRGRFCAVRWRCASGQLDQRITSRADTRSIALIAIQGAFYAPGPFAHHVRINHGGLHVRMAKQLLYRADVVAVFKQVGGKAVAEGVATRRLRDPCCPHCILYRTLDGFFMYVMPDRTT